MYLPCVLRLCSRRSLTSGKQPPQPVPAFVHFFIVSTVSLPSITALQIESLLTLSQLQINASSGKPDTPALVVSPPLEPKITSSGLAGSSILFLHVWSSIL